MINQKITFLSIFLIFSQLISSINTDSTVYPISESVKDDSNYNKAEFQIEEAESFFYFKYSVSSVPSSRIGAFRFDLGEITKTPEVLCKFLSASSTDAQIISELDALDSDNSACVGGFINGVYDGIFKYDETKKLLAFVLKKKGTEVSKAKAYVRHNENVLTAQEQTVQDNSLYSLIPFTLVISDFRIAASKILFYSRTRDMQMFYVGGDKPYPERLFFGNIMSVYTNPNMVRQKYKNANTMILLPRQFEQEEPMGEQFLFQIKLFPSDFTLDYYMGINQSGREKNTPLVINMTQCEEPYYVILNYNQPEAQVNLYIDQIYGKLKSLSVAPTFTNAKWDDMIVKDMKAIDITQRKYTLPRFSPTHMDVYKVECEVPVLLNFYYVDEGALIPELDLGQVVISTLRENKDLSVPFAQRFITPQITIEIFNPSGNPVVTIHDGQNDFVVKTNQLVKTMPFSSGGVVVKERGGLSDTRVIVKLGYNTNQWKTVSENIMHNEAENIFVFSFPVGTKKYMYKYALLETSGTNADDNVKYCYSGNIGNAIVASTDNCYRVSKANSYTIKIMNPAIMYKDYELEDNLMYYVTLTPLYVTDEFTIKATLYEYSTENRNYEGVGNVITLGSSATSSILGYPKEDEAIVFYQITSCNGPKLNYGIYDALTEAQIVPNTDIADNQKNYFSKFNNVFSETELRITGTSGNKVYIKHKGIPDTYTPDIKSSFPLSFDETNNQIKFTKPLNGDFERLTYTVYVAKDGEISSKGLTLCSFFDKTDLSGFHSRTFNTFREDYTLTINFKKVGLTKGQKFEAIALIEQDLFSQMTFVTDVLQGTVGEIKEETITKVETVYEDDNDYVYYYQEKKDVETTFYYSFINSNVFDVPVGAFRIELDNGAEGLYSTVYCAWVDENEDAISSVDAVEEIIDVHKPYCIGGVNKKNDRNYNYIFRYTYTSDNKPRKFIIKVPAVKAGVGFHIYIRKGENTQITQSQFHEQTEYGRQEQYKKSVMPYILDLPSIRGTSDDYISKILLYSKYFDMQMYYIDSSGKDIPQNNNAPVKLFTGNVMLVLTNPNLAQQKYFSKKLILLSEDIRGQKDAEAQNTFRFHTKMFKSTDQIEYFLSSEALGRNLNSPLSLEMNTCTSYNNVYYYILNYNYPQEEMNLYLDLVFGSMRRARIVTEFTEEKWDDLISNRMVEISDYFTTIPESSTHIDIVEIQCNTPLLINAYYNTQNYNYGLISLGDVVVRNLNPKESFSFSLDNTIISTLYYSIQVYSPSKNPNIKITFSNGVYNSVNENSLKIGMLMGKIEDVSLTNNGDSLTRIIFKIGFSVESDWTDSGADIEGTIYSYNNQFVYKFPAGYNKLNFTSVDISVNPLNRDVENIKFCYSTSIGMAITTSLENCFRTGANIPYTLTFLNPLVATKNYKRYVDNYYVTLIPVSSADFISLKVEEHKYETKDRNSEGAAKIITFDTATKATILSISQLEEDADVVVQLFACKASNQMINYVNKNPITSDVISTGNVTPRESLHYYRLSNNYYETNVEFSGAVGDQVLVKHTGILSSYNINYQKYTLTFNERTNQVTIVKPIFNEEFTFYVLVGKKDTFKDYNLCTFHQNNINDLGDYVKIFTSVDSNQIEHYIDFRSIIKNKYTEGDEFDLIVFATQTKNSKLEFLYDLIQGKVGKVEYVFVEVEGKLEDNVVTQTFPKNSSNYLYYDFESVPTGNVATLRVRPGDSSLTITRVICTFVQRGTTDLDMLNAVNAAALSNDNVCKGQQIKNAGQFDALINAQAYAKDNDRKRLLIQIIYGFGDEDNEQNEDIVEMNINIRTSGFDVSESDKGFNENENSAIVPYVLDLTKIRQSSQTDYISKVLIYSSKRELEMYHLQSTAPTLLFTGNIMLVYTNPEVVKEKYSGATTMILLTTPLTKADTIIIGENFRFKTYFFKSDNSMNYYVSSNPGGRPLNTPIIVEMPSCEKPYYYILNYHYPEENKRIVLHIDEVYGELSSKRIATRLNKEDWYDLVDSMIDMEGNEYLISQTDQYHMDVIEVSCTLPSLLHFYYVNEDEEETQGVSPGDISIINLAPGTNKDITLQIGMVNLTYIYTFNVLTEGKDPKIKVTFQEGEPLEANKNGYYIHNVNKFLSKINIENEEMGGSTWTKVYFKYGYSMEDKFTKIQNDIYYYSNNDNRLFGYKFSTGDDRLNYTNVSFLISTKESNVKFCYTTNFGSYMQPSSQDCYRVGISNTYTLNILNPYLMYKDYYIGDDVLPYYVSFKTDDPYSNITIKPTLNKYKANKRNFENIPSTIDITRQGSTILTPSSEDKPYIFIQMQVCDANKEIEYNLLNAFNGSSLNAQGNVKYDDDKVYYRSILSTKLDTELQITTETYTRVFVKHTTLEDQYTPSVVDINMKFFKDNNTLSFNQPIAGEQFKYTVYVDGYDQIKNKNYRLCNFVGTNDVHYSQSVISADEYVFIKIDFDAEKIKNLESFDMIILAEQTDNGRLMILSEVLQAEAGGTSTSRTVLIVVISVLAVVLIAGGIGVYFFLKKYKSRPNSKRIDAKQTSLADVDNPNEKMIMSTATEKND